jgi:hypothetical protein
MTVKGIDEQVARFKRLQGDLQAFEIGEIINFALAQVETEAKSQAPVFTGALRNSIVHYMINDFSGECIVGVPYAAAQEYGYTTPSGGRVPGKNYFMPAAMHGQKTLIAELNKYIATACKGQVDAKPPKAAKGTRGGLSSARKYQFKQATGAGTRYIYAKTTQASKFRMIRKPGGRKQPTTAFQRRKPGSGSRR